MPGRPVKQPISISFKVIPAGTTGADGSPFPVTNKKPANKLGQTSKRVPESFSNDNSWIVFPAFIDSLTDSFNPVWDETLDMGRASPKVMYKQFNRTLDLSFKSIAYSKDSQDSTFAFYRLNELSKAVYPIYGSSVGYIGNYIRFSIGSMYVQEYGYVTSLSYDWSGDETIWDLDSTLPMYTNVNISINWIGSKRPDSTKTYAFSKPKGGFNQV